MKVVRIIVKLASRVNNIKILHRTKGVRDYLEQNLCDRGGAMVKLEIICI